MAGKLWVRQILRNKIDRDVIVPCEDGDWVRALQAACHVMDVGAPMVIPRHDRDWASFRQARFLPESFMESVRFDRLEAEYFDPDEKKKPRGIIG